MDIHEWLAATADRAEPNPSDDHRIPEELRAHPLPPARVHGMGRSCRRKKRKRASSDSSIIAPRPTNRPPAQPVPRSLPSERARSAESADQASQKSGYSSPSASPSPVRIPGKSYERRSRHKTRPDRYEPKPKKQRDDHDAHKDKKSGKKKRRKSHRSGDGGRTAGLVQSFQLKNGPKNNRLTIKPGATAGLFKHGRASAQMAGRGGGLPDLVFNEMKFLQRPAEHQDALPDAGDQQQQKKKDRGRPNEGEISAYFRAKKPALEQQRGQEETRSLYDGGKDGRRSQQEKQRRRHPTPPVELPPKPFLGFGSKGAQHDSGEQPSEPTTYSTWSQSARQPSTAARRQDHARGQDTGERPPKSSRRLHAQPSRQRQPTAGEQEFKSPNADEEEENHHGTWVQTRKAEGGALVEMYQPPAKPAHRDKHERMSTISQSLPKRLDLDPAERRQRRPSRSEDRTDDEYRTSDILKIVREHATTSSKAQGNGYVSVNQLRAEKENQTPESALSIDRLLDHARYFNNKDRDDTRLAPSFDRHRTSQHEDGGPRSRRTESFTAIPVRGEALQAFDQRHEQPPSRARGSRHTPTMSLRQAEENVQDMLRVQQTRAHISAPLNPVMFESKRHAAQDEEEMLDDGFTFEPALNRHERVYSDVQGAEEPALTSTLTTTPGIFEAQSEGLEAEGDLRWQPQHTTPRTAFIGRHTSIGRTVGSEMVSRPASGAADDGMSGFWKPNKLY